jgi:hypothetical protein
MLYKAVVYVHEWARVLSLHDYRWNLGLQLHILQYSKEKLALVIALLISHTIYISLQPCIILPLFLQDVLHNGILIQSYTYRRFSESCA